MNNCREGSNFNYNETQFPFFAQRVYPWLYMLLLLAITIGDLPAELISEYALVGVGAYWIQHSMDVSLYFGPELLHYIL